MDVGSNNKYPAGALSNFSGHRFFIDGVQCNSMEGFLQSLKCATPDMQVHICSLVGFAAKKNGSRRNWKTKQMLHWQGCDIPRKSEEYQDLLDVAFMNMYRDSESFRKALKASGNATLTHSIGRRKITETVLTINEFTSRLTKLRDNNGVIT